LCLELANDHKRGTVNSIFDLRSLLPQSVAVWS
jgi:hypothetical protein